MDRHVFTQTTGYFECSTTFLTLVGTYCTMSYHVRLKSAMMGKCLGTLWTFVWSLTSVCAHVHFHCARMRETFITYFAWIRRALFVVHKFVLLQIASCFEYFLTNFAFEYGGFAIVVVSVVITANIVILTGLLVKC